MKTLPLIEAAELLDIYNQPGVLLFDVSNGPNAQANYAAEHIAGAVFVDLNTQLTDIKEDVSNGGRHPLPAIETFANTLTTLGIYKNSRVIIYDDKNAWIHFLALDDAREDTIFLSKPSHSHHLPSTLYHITLFKQIQHLFTLQQLLHHVSATCTYLTFLRYPDICITHCRNYTTVKHKNNSIFNVHIFFRFFHHAFLPGSPMASSLQYF